jgi:hypothetical protein
MLTHRQIENAIRRAVERENSRAKVQARNRKNSAKFMNALKAEKNRKMKPLSPRLRARATLTPVSVLRRNAFRKAVKSPARPNLRRAAIMATQARRMYTNSLKHI